MTQVAEQFELNYKGGIMHVHEIPLAGQQVSGNYSLTSF
jgi:hypothetical protein